MIYLNVILTILCLILLSFFISIIYFWKKYGKKIMEFTKPLPMMNVQNNSTQDLDSTLQMVENLFKKLDL